MLTKENLAKAKPMYSVQVQVQLMRV